MTMFSAEDPRPFSGGYGGGFCNYMSYDQACRGSDLVTRGGAPMAEDESRTESTREEEKDEGWLQLSIGGSRRAGLITGEENMRRDGPGLVELELLPSRPSGPIPEFHPPRPVANFPSGAATGFSPSFFLHQHPGNSSTTNFQRRQEMNWAFRPVDPINITSASSSTSTFSSFPSTLMASGSLFSRPPFQIYPALVAGPRPHLDFRVIPPPRRPHSGIWFMLQASKFQEKEPYLPQISKSYLRIKDGRMTIRLVLKYLINKLSLENESEIEVRCKGEKLQPMLTLQHVRDNIWMSTNRDTYVTLLPNSSTFDHIMVLHYARTTASSNSLLPLYPH